MESDPAAAHDELVKKMARAMAAKDSGPEGSVLFEFHWREFGEGYLSGAVAALAVARPVIREECVRVAHEQRCERDTPWGHACLAIAAAIRAME